MARSTKKGPYIDEKIIKKINQMEAAGEKQPIKTWARGCTVSPLMVGYTLLIHNGRTFNEVFITEAMVGHKLGEFAPTRRFISHSKKGYVKTTEDGGE